MLRKPRRTSTQEINSSSMSDIAFLLLVFFLVTTTISLDKGISLVLPADGNELEVNRKNILTVNSDYSYNQRWGKIACYIEDYDNIWQTRSLFGKLLKLLFMRNNFEIIVFNYDVKLAFLFSLFHHICPYKGKLKKCIFVTLLIDVSIFNIKINSDVLILLLRIHDLL